VPAGSGEHGNRGVREIVARHGLEAALARRPADHALRPSEDGMKSR
jgi:hypothetical protein